MHIRHRCGRDGELRIVLRQIVGQEAIGTG